MASFISLVNNQGRLFGQSPTTEQDGLFGVIDLNVKGTQNYASRVAFNSSGDQIIIQDLPRGQISLLQMKNNRFSTVATNQKNAPTALNFTGQIPSDQIIFALKDKSFEVHSLNGKIIQTTQAGQHCKEIINIDMNVKLGLLLSVSADTCNLWTSQGDKISKIRTLDGKDGCQFVNGRFTCAGDQIATLFKDGEYVQWTLDTFEKVKMLKFRVPVQITTFDISNEFVIAGSTNCQFLFRKTFNKPDVEEYFRLPPSYTGAESITFLSNTNIIAFLSEGQLLLIDIADSLKVILNLRLPHQSIKSYAIDFNVNTLLVTGSGGNAFIYDLKKALENEKSLAQGKIKMGLDSRKVYLYLERVCSEQFYDQVQGTISGSGDLVFGQEINDNGLATHKEGEQPSFLGTAQHHNESQMSAFGPSSITGRRNPFTQRSTCEIQSQYNMNRSCQITGRQQQQQQQYHQQAPIVESTHKTSMKSIIHFDDRDENLSAGVPTSSIAKSRQSVYGKQSMRSMITVTGPNNKNTSIINKSTMSQQPVLDENFKPEYGISKINNMGQFNMGKLKKMLKQYQQYPDDYRSLTWQYLLQLPLNKDAFETLLNKGVHPAFNNLHKKYPINSYRLYNKLVRIMSALGYWSPIFLDVDYMPALIFPFIKAIPNDDLVVFEVIVSLIVQWQSSWFEQYPTEPLSILNSLEEIIGKEDDKLMNHFRQNSFSAIQYAWPFLKTMYTEVFSKDDWFKLFDHLFTYKEDPELLIYFTAAYLLIQKGFLLQVNSIEQMLQFVMKPSTVNFKKLTGLAFKLHAKYKNEIYTGAPTTPMIPLSLPTYPSFVKYPEYIVSINSKIRDKVIQEEEEISKKEQLLKELKSKAEDIIEQEERFRRQQDGLLRAETERKQKQQMEQELLLQERIRLDEMTRVARLEHIKKIEDQIGEAMKHQQKLSEQESQLMQEALDAKMRAAKYEYEARVQDEVISNIEFKANQRLLELMQKQTSDEQQRKFKNELEYKMKEEEQRERVIQEKWKLEDQEQRLKNELMRQTLYSQAQAYSQANEKAQVEQQMRLQEHERELQVLKLEEQRRMRQMEEEHLVLKQQLVDDMKRKEMQQREYEQQQMGVRVEMERERDASKASCRLNVIDKERQILEQKLLQERKEANYKDEITRQRSFEQHMQSIQAEKDMLEARQQEQAEQIHKQYQDECHQFEAKRQALLQKEHELHERDRFINYLRETEHKVHSIVDQSQNKQHLEKMRQEFEDYESKTSDINKQKPLQQPSCDYERLVQERSMQYREQNEQMRRDMTGGNKENFQNQNNLQYQHNEYQNYEGSTKHAALRDINFINSQKQGMNPYTINNDRSQQQQQYYDDRQSEYSNSQQNESRSNSCYSESEYDSQQTSSIEIDTKTNQIIQKHYEVKQALKEQQKIHDELRRQQQLGNTNNLELSVTQGTGVFNYMPGVGGGEANVTNIFLKGQGKHGSTIPHSQSETYYGSFDQQLQQQIYQSDSNFQQTASAQHMKSLDQYQPVEIPKQKNKDKFQETRGSYLLSSSSSDTDSPHSSHTSSIITSHQASEYNSKHQQQRQAFDNNRPYPYAEQNYQGYQFDQYHNPQQLLVSQPLSGTEDGNDGEDESSLLSSVSNMDSADSKLQSRHHNPHLRSAAFGGERLASSNFNK